MNSMVKKVTEGKEIGGRSKDCRALLIELSIKLITIVLSNYELPLVIYQSAT